VNQYVISFVHPALLLVWVVVFQAQTEIEFGQVLLDSVDKPLIG
jgi:hypothetical protein